MWIFCSLFKYYDTWYCDKVCAYCHMVSSSATRSCVIRWPLGGAMSTVERAAHGIRHRKLSTQKPSWQILWLFQGSMLTVNRLLQASKKCCRWISCNVFSCDATEKFVGPVKIYRTSRSYVLLVLKGVIFDTILSLSLLLLLLLILSLSLSSLLLLFLLLLLILLLSSS